MNDLRQMLYIKGRIGKVLEAIRKEGIPDPAAEPDRALIHAHAVFQYGDLPQALRIYSAVPPHPDYDAERLWGLAKTLSRMGDLEQAKRLLDEALVKNPPDWLLPHIYNTWVSIHLLEGNFEEGYRAIEQGIAASEREPAMVMRWVLEGNRGVMQINQGLHEQAVLTLQRAVKQLLARDAILSAGHALIILGTEFDSQCDQAEAERFLSQAEGLVRESGSKHRLIYLRLAQGNLWVRMGLLDKAERSYEEVGKLLRELPILEFEINLGFFQAHLAFKKGNVSLALRLVRKAKARAREKGLPLFEDWALFHEGSFLVRAGAIREGMEILKPAAAMAERRKELDLLRDISLHLALGCEELGQREEALKWLGRCFAALERSRAFPQILDEREVLVPLLLRLGETLPLTDTLSNLIVQLRHPALLKRLLRHDPPKGKILFVRSLTVHDASPLRIHLKRLRRDELGEVRRASRLLLSGWQQHVGYRVYTLGNFRVFLEGKPFIEGTWRRAGVKRLFLYFLSRPEEWQATEALLETLWEKKNSRPRSPKALWPLYSYLRSLFEPWHLPGMVYVFFLSRRGAYGFFPGERFWIDYQEFERGIKKAEKDQLARNFKEARKAYREALDLYLGDYLEEFPYEDWLRPKRDNLRELYFRGVMRYAALERDSGNLPEARRVLEEALFKDLSRSGCAALLIQILIQMKLTHEAKDWGQRHIQYMKKELKEKPAPEVLEALGKLG